MIDSLCIVRMKNQTNYHRRPTINTNIIKTHPSFQRHSRTERRQSETELRLLSMIRVNLMKTLTKPSRAIARLHVKWRQLTDNITPQ